MAESTGRQLVQRGFHVLGFCVCFHGDGMFLNWKVEVLLTLGSVLLSCRGHTDTAARRRH